MKLRNIVFVAVLLLTTVSCGRQFDYFPDMWYSPAVGPQMKDRMYGRQGTMLPPENTLPYKTYHSFELDDVFGVSGLTIDGRTFRRSTEDEQTFASETVAPTFDKLGFMSQIDMIERGKDRYEIYCAPCHGMSGKADGPVQKKIVHVTPLTRKKADVPVASEGYNVARIYLASTLGIRTMSGYASQINNKDRWALSYYVKELQKNDLKKQGSK